MSVFCLSVMVVLLRVGCEGCNHLFVHFSVGMCLSRPRYSTSHRKMSTSSNVSQSSNQSSQSAVSAAAAAAASAAMAAAAASSVAIPAVITTQSPMSSAMVMQSPHGSTHIVQQQQQQLLQQQPILVGTPDSAISLLASSSSSSASLAGADSGLMVEQTAETDWNYDPNEPRYCICNQVSYGDMVACDNEAVSIATCSMI